MSPVTSWFLKSNISAGLSAYAAKACLEMQVRTCASACVAAEADGLACLNNLVFLYQVFRHVAVDGLKSVVVAYHDGSCRSRWPRI